MDIYYFGCWDRPGHFLHGTNGYQVYDSMIPKDFPVGDGAMDGGLLPRRLPQVEGRAELIHFPAWTILAFWDRSVDSRGGCNSCFIMRGVQGFEEAVCIAKEAFPQVWRRFKFPVIKHAAGEETFHEYSR